MMQVTELDINEIIPYVNNPRDNTAARKLGLKRWETLTGKKAVKL